MKSGGKTREERPGKRQMRRRDKRQNVTFFGLFLEILHNTLETLKITSVHSPGAANKVR